MAEKKSTPKKKSVPVAKVGLGLTAAATAVAGAYFLYGSKNAAKNRKKVKSWSLKAKAEVLEGLERAEQLTDEEYKKLVDAATGVYGTVKSATKGEVADFKKEMLTHWKDLQKNTAVRKLAATAMTKQIIKKTMPKKTASKKTSTPKKATGKKSK